ncbi:hypothetical protein BSKO_00274 [Bryopsis sp. KO-2023]|nr:hypothetical protein BSKO_00274 [Bryopsis sp. KO-2023]
MHLHRWRPGDGEIHPLTGVTHCASAYFTCCATSDEGANSLSNVIQFCTTQLQFYNMRSLPVLFFSFFFHIVELKLELVERCPLYGELNSVVVLKI